MSNFSSDHNLAIQELEPYLGSILTAQSLDPASDSVCVCVCVCVCVYAPTCLSKINLKNLGEWLGGSVECPTLAQVMVLQFTDSSPTSGSERTAQSLEPTLDSVSPSLTLPCLFPLLAAPDNLFSTFYEFGFFLFPKDSTCKWYHAAFLFLCLAYFT